jgi:hypothetical protein
MYQLWNALPLHMPQSVVQSLQPCWLPCEAISVAPMSDTRGVYREHGHDQGEGVTCPWLGSIVTVTRSINHAAVVLPSDCPQHDRLGRSGTASLHLRFALLHQPYPCTRARRIQGPGERGRAELPEPAGGMDTEGEARVLRQCCCWPCWPWCAFGRARRSSEIALLWNNPTTGSSWCNGCRGGMFASSLVDAERPPLARSYQSHAAS